MWDKILKYIKFNWETLIKLLVVIVSVIISAFSVFFVGNHYGITNVFIVILMALSVIAMAISFYNKSNFKYNMIFNCIGIVIYLVNIILTIVYQNKIINYSFKNINIANMIASILILSVLIFDTIWTFKVNHYILSDNKKFIKLVVFKGLMVTFALGMLICNCVYYYKEIKQEHKAQSIYFEEEKYVLYDIGQSLELKYNFYPNDATKEDVKFITLNEDVAIVNKQGVVTATGFGITGIYMTTNTGKTATTIIEVKNISLEVISKNTYFYENTSGTLEFLITDYDKQAIDESTILQRLTYGTYETWNGDIEYQPSTITFSNYRYQQGVLKLDYQVGEIASYSDEESFYLGFYDNKYGKIVKCYSIYTKN